MVDTAPATSGAYLRRDAILEAVAFASERLLLASDWRDAADDVLTRLGVAAGVSRAYIIQNRVTASGLDAAQQVAEWCAPGISSQFGNPSLEEAPWRETGFGRWVEVLGRGGSISGVVRDFPDSERPELEHQGIVSIAVFPVQVDGAWWGLVGFDDCVSARDWSRAELDALRAAATVLGAAVWRRRADEQLRESEHRYRSLVDNSPEAILVHTEGRFVYANRAAAELLAAPEPSALVGLPIRTIVHPDHREEVERRVAAEHRGIAAPLLRQRLVRLDGELVDVEVAGIPVTYRGKPAGQIVVRDITESVRAERQLREAETRYRQFVEHIPAVTYMDVLEEGGARVAFISPQVEALLGYPRERFMDDPDFWWSIVHPDDRDRVEEAGTRTSKEGVPFDERYRMTAADGRVVWVHDTSTAVRDERGDLLYWLGFLTDVTAAREAEERRHLAEERYRLIVEHTPAIVYQEPPAAGPYSHDDAFNYLSPQVETLLGYPLETLTNDPAFFWTIVHPDDRDWLFEESARTAATGEPYRAEYRVIAADGREIWIHDESVLVHDEDGAPLHWQGVMIDITERKRAEEDLRESQERNRLTVETALDAFVGMDADGRITGWNPQAEITFGWPRDLVMGRQLADVIIPERLRGAHRGGLRRYLESGEERVLGRRIEVTALHRDGREFPAELAISPIRWGDRVDFSAFVRDITERKLAEEELQRALEVEREASQRLRALDEMKNTFLQAVSHDLRTPLAAILGLAVTLERAEVRLDEDDARDLAGRIATNARRLERLVSNLLDLDRLARGIVEPNLEPTDVGALVRRVLSESELLASAEVRMDIGEAVVSADPAKVERIVENLLSNTARHASAAARVWVSVREVDGGALILVEDDGPGVRPELREAIFEPFRQGPDVPQHSPGVGVGLTLVRRFAELHGGRAWVEEHRESGGASFRVFLPETPPNGAVAAHDPAHDPVGPARDPARDPTRDPEGDRSRDAG